MSIALTLDGQPFAFDGDPGTPLLWAVCGAARSGRRPGPAVSCTACRLRLDGAVVRACAVPVAAAAGAAVATISGRAGGGALCRPGTIVAAALSCADPSATIEAVMAGLYICGTEAGRDGTPLPSMPVAPTLV